ADQRQRLGLGLGIARPQAEPLAEIRQDRGVLGEALAVVEPYRRHAPLRVDLQVALGALLAAGEIDPLWLVLLAALFEHDVGRHRARTRGVIKRQTANSSLSLSVKLGQAANIPARLRDVDSIMRRVASPPPHAQS